MTQVCLEWVKHKSLKAGTQSGRSLISFPNFTVALHGTLSEPGNQWVTAKCGTNIMLNYQLMPLTASAEPFASSPETAQRIECIEQG